MSSMKVCTRYIEPMDMAGDDGEKDEDAVEHAVPAHTAQNHHRQRRKEYVYHCDHNSVCKPANHGCSLLVSRQVICRY